VAGQRTDNLIARFYGVDEGKGPHLKENFDAFIEQMLRRRERHEPVVIVIDGRETGVGKSTLAMHICRRLDPHFGMEKITYSAKETLDLYATAQPGSMVDWDESVLGLLTRKGTRDEELTGIISALSIVRKNEIGTVLTVPKIRMLDTLVYNGLAPIWLFVEARGRVRVHRAYKGAQYRKSQPRIAYDLWERISPMGFGSLDRDPLFRKAVERAIERNRQYFNEQSQIAEAKRSRLLGLGRTRDKITKEDNVPERAVSPVCVCAGCGYSWRPRSGTGGRCPRCRSYQRGKPVSGSATRLSSAT
jgi:predicted Zn-ribbon and HTH transcriptional regulator